MQEVAEESGTVRLQGTLLASLLRGHKLRPGELSASTEHDLRDCSLPGKPPALVAEEMFEGGIFGFVPVLLLNLASGNAFRTLDLHRQTLLISPIPARMTVPRVFSSSSSSFLQYRGCRCIRQRMDIPHAVASSSLGKDNSRKGDLPCHCPHSVVFSTFA